MVDLPPGILLPAAQVQDRRHRRGPGPHGGQAHDIGLILKRARDGSLGFEVMVGGGLGRTPYIGPTIREFLPAARLLSYLEAILRVYNRHGRRDNIYKARIKILVAALGVEEFARQVEAEWEKMGVGSDLPDVELARIRGAFAPKSFETLPAVSEAFEAAKAADPAFARFVRNNVQPHKAAGLRHRRGLAEGHRRDARRRHRRADGGRRRPRRALRPDDMRVTHEQNLVLPHVKLDDLPAVWAALEAAGLATRQHRPDHRHHRLPGAGLLRPGQCPGDPDRPAHRRALRRSGPRRGDRRAEDQDLRLHQRLRPPPRRPHRHPGRR